MKEICICDISVPDLTATVVSSEPALFLSKFINQALKARLFILKMDYIENILLWNSDKYKLKCLMKERKSVVL